MYTFLMVVHIFIAVALIVLVLMQHGKGADMGAAFGSGASGTVFGARGSANFLSRSTAVLATVFFITSLGLAMMGNAGSGDSGSVVDRIQAPVDAPAQPAAPADTSTPAPAAPAQ